MALQYGVTGPMLRASGIAHDLRKAQPYSGYEQYDFDVPTQIGCDTYARYLVRIEEMRQSLRIVEQALNKLPLGPVRSNNRKYVPPPRSELGTSMEALIHHFKLWTEGFTPPEGSVYVGDRVAARRVGCLPGERRRPEALPGALAHAFFYKYADLTDPGQRPPGGRPGAAHRDGGYCPGRCRSIEEQYAG